MRSSTRPDAGNDRPGPPGDEDRWHLEDEREFLRRSLADADAEHAAGDLSDGDYRALRRRDEARLADVQTTLGSLGAPATRTAAPRAAGPPAPDRSPEEGAVSGRWRRRRWFAVLGVAAVVAGAVLVVLQLATPRLPGQTPTGSLKLTASQNVNRQLAQAADEEQHGDLSGALTLYGKVLGEDPDEAEALAEFGWIEWETGANAAVRRDGETLVQRAEREDPGAYAAHLYLGTIELLGSNDAVAAADQFSLFLAGHPPAAKVSAAAGYIRQAFKTAGRPLPADVPGAPPSTGGR